jgi:hypothetical protein
LHRWDYCLCTFPASGTPLDKRYDPNDPSYAYTQNIIKLPPACLTVKDLPTEYDPKGFGLPGIPQLSIFFDLYSLENSRYDEIRAAIKNPYSSFIKDGITIKTGLTYELYIKYNKNSDPAVNIYREKFVGVQTEFEDAGYDFEKREATIKADDVNFTTLSNIVMKILSEFPDDINTDTITVEELIDLLYNGHKIYQKYDGLHGTPTHYKLFYISQIVSYLKNIAESIYRGIRRDDSLDYHFEIPFARYSKQTDDGSGEQGDSLLDMELLVLGGISSLVEGGSGQGGLLSEDESSLFNRYKNSLWDFLVDQYQSEYKKGILEPNGIHASYPYSDIADFAAVGINPKDLFKPKFISSGKLKTVQSSLYESINDDDFCDIDKIDYADTGTRNEGSFTLPIVFNNMPVAAKYMGAGDNRFCPFPHIWGLYYKGDFDRILRVHEYVDFKLSLQKWSFQIPGCEFVPFAPNDYDANKPSEMMIAMQAETCKPFLGARFLQKVYGNPRSTKIEITVDFDDYVYFDENDYPGFVWGQSDALFDIDLSLIDPDCAYLKTNGKMIWVFTKHVLDFDNEKAVCELTLRTF